MTGLARAFVAVVPPPSVLRGIESLVDSLDSLDSPSDSLGDSLHSLDSSSDSLGDSAGPGTGLRWAPRQQWHLTLQFLGRLDEPDSFAESLGESLRRVTPFPLRLGGGGAFPAPGRGSVLWVGVTSGGAELARLAQAVAAVSGVTGDRPFRPHVTLARAPRARDLRSLVAALGAGPIGPSWTVDHALLFESDTRPDGAVHTERARLALRG